MEGTANRDRFVYALSFDKSCVLVWIVVNISVVAVCRRAQLISLVAVVGELAGRVFCAAFGCTAVCT